MSPDPRDAAETSDECESNAKLEKTIVSSTNKVETELEERTKQDLDTDLSDQVESASPMRNESQSPPVAAHGNQASDSNHEDLRAPKREKCTYGGRCYR